MIEQECTTTRENVHEGKIQAVIIERRTDCTKELATIPIQED
jgi:hypothetical protein